MPNLNMNMSKQNKEFFTKLINKEKLSTKNSKIKAVLTKAEKYDETLKKCAQAQTLLQAKEKELFHVNDKLGVVCKENRELRSKLYISRAVCCGLSLLSALLLLS